MEAVRKLFRSCSHMIMFKFEAGPLYAGDAIRHLSFTGGIILGASFGLQVHGGYCQVAPTEPVLQPQLQQTLRVCKPPLRQEAHICIRISRLSATGADNIPYYQGIIRELIISHILCISLAGLAHLCTMTLSTAC